MEAYIKAIIQLVHSFAGNKGQSWMKVELPVHAFESGQLMIEGERGRDYRGDIAIDDVQLVDGSCQGNQFIFIIEENISQTLLFSFLKFSEKRF